MRLCLEDGEFGEGRNGGIGWDELGRREFVNGGQGGRGEDVRVGRVGIVWEGGDIALQKLLTAHLFGEFVGGVPLRISETCLHG